MDVMFKYKQEIIACSLLTDINECFEAALKDEELCERNSQCINTEGSFDCVCVSGFVLVNDTCQRK